ncbi:hypothetical protein CR152_21255 [Massilia violaceinigra]|uniref:Uncharacterized protein n=1 Tax=Massilia violaceinigra TaxID=2045208 RepID=A0A2D2DP50_9BURK|nr:hypothetical protein [Massilia violaceinigra]ATQ76758.1 hypothetical protein CR152_21255 [Massilia violaceinigra]
MAWDINIVDIGELQAPDRVQVFDFSVALEKAFSYPDDFFVIEWNGIGLKMPFSYCLSDVLEDVLDIIEELMKAEAGEYYTGFSPNEVFDCDWRLDWKGDRLEISAEWRQGLLPIDELVEHCSKCIVSKEHFLMSWRTLFEYCVKKLSEINFDYESNEQSLQISRMISNIN